MTRGTIIVPECASRCARDTITTGLSGPTPANVRQARQEPARVLKLFGLSVMVCTEINVFSEEDPHGGRQRVGSGILK
jgi:hypothetical protein